MTPEEGALFLLRRANIIGPDAELDRVSDDDRTQALAISQFGQHQVQTGSEPADFTSTKSCTNLRKIGLRGSGNAGSAVLASIGSGFPNA